MRKSQALIAFSLCLNLLAIPVFSQQDEEETVALMIQNPLTIDGLLIENEWRAALEASTYLQTHPLRDDPFKVQTVVKILYSNEYLYIGFDCIDTEPDNIRAKIDSRDGDLRNDDSVYVLIDSVHDHEHLYCFAANLLGTRSDGKLFLEKQEFDFSWQGDWQAAAQRTAFGWSAEISISLSHLGYKTNAPKSLRLGLSRVVPRLDGLFWSGPLDPAFNLDLPGTISSLELADVFRTLKIEAYAMGDKISTEDFNAIAGLDIEYIFNSKTTGNITVFPDFATVQPDQELINLTEFELRLDELRDYFFKGFNSYQQPLELFYTKRVGDLYGGIKLYGETGSLEFAGSSLQTKKVDSLDLDSANVSSLRLKNSFGKILELGITAANRNLENNNLGSVGADGLVKIGEYARFYGLFAYSYGDYDEDNKALLLKASYDTDSFHTHFSYSHIEDRFWDNANQIGFLYDDNRKEVDLAFDKSFLFKAGGNNGIEYLSKYNVYWGMDNTLRSWQLDQELALIFGGGWRVGTHFKFDYKLNEYFPSIIPEDRFIPAAMWNAYRTRTIASMSRWDPAYVFELVNPSLGSGNTGEIFYYGSQEYKNRHIRIFSGFDSGQNDAFYLAYGFGRHYAESMNTFELYKELTITSTIFLQYEFSLINFSTKIEPVYVSTGIHVIKANFQVTPSLAFAGFFQALTGRNKQNLWLDAKYLVLPPYGFIQLVYKYGLAGFGEPDNTDNAVYLKLNYGF